MLHLKATLMCWCLLLCTPQLWSNSTTVTTNKKDYSSTNFSTSTDLNNTILIVDAGENDTVCLYNYELIGTPEGGTWSLDCAASAGNVVFSTPANDSTFVTASNCGNYFFIYTALDDNGTIASDTVEIFFDNIGSFALDQDMIIEVSAEGGTCPMGEQIGCNLYEYTPGTPPDIKLAFSSEQTCSSEVFSAESFGVTNCIANSIAITSQTFNDSGSSFLCATDVGGDNFFDYIDSSFEGLSCALPPGSCLPPPMPIDTILDTIMVDIPVGYEAEWVFNIDGEAPVALTDDTTFISYNGSNLVIELPLGADYCGDTPAPLNLWEVSNNQWIPPTIGILFFLDKEYTTIYETAQRIRATIIYEPTNYPICQTIFLDGYGINLPPLDDFDCPPVPFEYMPPPPDQFYTEIICPGDLAFVEICGNFETLSAGFYTFLCEENGCEYIIFVDIFEEFISDEFYEGIVCLGETYSIEVCGQTENLPAGTYQFPCTDFNGCFYFIFVEVMEYPITPDELYTGVVCPGETYLIDVCGQTENLPAGTYQFPCTDFNGCTYFIEVEVLEENAPPDQFYSETVCAGNFTVVDVCGENMALGAGSYTFECEENGCSYNLFLEIIDIFPVDEFYSGTVCAGETFAIDICGQQENLDAGLHNFDCIDGNGCVYFIQVEVTEEAATPDEFLTDQLCPDETAEYQVCGTTYTLGIGTYVYQCIDANGCSYDYTIDIQEDMDCEDCTTPDEFLTDQLCPDETAEYQVCGTTYTLGIGTYVYQCIDANDCSYDYTIDILENLACEDCTTPDEFLTDQLCPDETAEYQVCGTTYTLGIGTHVYQCIDANDCSYDYTIDIQEDMDCEDCVDVVGEFSAAICDGACFDWNGINYCQSGVYEQVFNAFNGCDSLVNLNLEVEQISTNLSLSNDITCIDNEATITLDVYGATNWTINWSTGIAGNQSSITVGTGGTYTAEIITVGGCTIIEEIEVSENVEPPFISIIEPNNINCIQSTVEIDASASSQGSAFIYEWVDENGDLISTDLNPIITTAGTYELTIINTNNGCEATDIAVVDSDMDLPIIEIATPTMLTCIQDIVNIDANNSSQGSEYSYVWTDENGNVISTELNPTISEIGDYELTIINTTSDCEVSETLTIEGNLTPPEVNDLNDLALTCATGGCTPGTPADAAYEYLWQGPGINAENETEAQPFVTEMGVYIRTVTNPNNSCTDIATMEVLPMPTIEAELATEAACWNTDGGTITVTDASGGTAPYLVSTDGENFTPDWNMVDLAAGLYDVQVQDANGCEWTEQLAVELIEPIAIEMLAEYITCGEAFVTINPIVNAIQSVDYQWSTGETTTSVDMNIAGNYSVQISNECELIEREFSIIQEANAANLGIYVPNVFSPNGDGENDCFGIYFEQVPQAFDLEIFNRWGNLLYKSSDPNGCWDGIFRGTAMQNEVFVWKLIATAQSCDGNLEAVKMYGDVTIIR